MCEELLVQNGPRSSRSDCEVYSRVLFTHEMTDAPLSVAFVD